VTPNYPKPVKPSHFRHKPTL